MSTEYPSRDEAEKAAEVLLAFIQKGLHDKHSLNSSKKIVDSFDAFFSGYEQKVEHLAIAHNTNDYHYDDIIIMKNIDIVSFCVHHAVPFVAKVSVGYIPDSSIVGLGTIIDLINIYARRLQLQERLTTQIAEATDELLRPLGVAVHIEGQHYCSVIASGGEGRAGILNTQSFRGLFMKDDLMRDRFMKNITS